jgi:hypothetical protein
MRTTVAAFVAGAVIGGAGIAGAAVADKAIVLTDHQAVSHDGITCTAYDGKTAFTGNLVCVRNDLKGYGVVISRTNVTIARSVKGTVKVIFTRKNK